MMIMENSIATPLLLLLRNLKSPLLKSAEKPLLFLTDKWKLLHLLTSLFISFSILILHFFFYSLPSPLPFSFPSQRRRHHNHSEDPNEDTNAGGAGSAIARALHQLLSLVSEVPVSSRKYDVVRSLAERLIHENLEQGSESLRQINCLVLSKGFATTIAHLQADLFQKDENNGGYLDSGRVGLGRAVKAVRGWYLTNKYGPSDGGACGHADGVLVEKMAAELLWLGQKLEGSGCVVVAIEKWAWASDLGRLALLAEPRIQASLVKLTAFLIKQAKDMLKDQGKGVETEQQKQITIKMLMAWLPLLCRASNGTDAPTLSTSERGEVERALEEIIDVLEEEENQEKVLSLWLNHFNLCPSSDWPNLYGSYIRWCSVSRKLMLSG